MWQLMGDFRAPILRQFTSSRAQVTSIYVNLRHREPNLRQVYVNLRHQEPNLRQFT